ncbi:MAG: D-alanine--D-alanine ligase [Flavobacteriales bacterium]|nr:D-alanine--D-alanine ligase [Flavobacteriales bacterium]
MEYIALVYGGFSGESEISKKSASEIFNAFDTSIGQPILVRIVDKNWMAEYNSKEYPIDKNDFSFSTEEEKIVFKSVFNIIHGTPGEDGKLAGYFDLLDISYNSSDVLTSALTFNKNWCNRFLSTYGIQVPKSVVLYKGEDNSMLYSEITYPCFVKPNNGGSSIGTHKVGNISELETALKDAFKYDTEVIVEEFIQGREFSVGIVFNQGQEKVMPLTEIIVDSEFFDYKQKYSDQGATETTPANIPSEQALECQEIVRKVFKVLRINKVARIDFILNDDTFYLIEVNTIPGMSSKSILPQQADYLGIDFRDLITTLA